MKTIKDIFELFELYLTTEDVLEILDEVKKMDELISKHLVLDMLDEIESEVADGLGYQYAKWRQYIAELPSAQPERKKGQWKVEHDLGVEFLACTSCKCRVFKDHYGHAVGNWGYNYCPYCGADMRGEQDDN